MIKLTNYEKMMMLAIPESEFNDGSTDYNGLWVWSVTDKVKEIAPASAPGVLSSLVKKGLITINDYEGRGRTADMGLSATDLGREVIAQLLKDKAEGKIETTRVEYENYAYVIQKPDNKIVRTVSSKKKAEAYLKENATYADFFFDWIENCAAVKDAEGTVFYWITKVRIY